MQHSLYHHPTLITAPQSSYGYVDYFDRSSAAIAIVTINERDARVMWDQKTGRSRGFGFVSFQNQQVNGLAVDKFVVIEPQKKTTPMMENIVQIVKGAKSITKKEPTPMCTWNVAGRWTPSNLSIND